MGSISPENAISNGICGNGKVLNLLSVVDELRDAGLEQYNLELPCIVVVGEQSHGKSSLLESISGIQLPRGKGTVTRHPIEIRMKRKEVNQYRVHLADGDGFECHSLKQIEDAINKLSKDILKAEKVANGGIMVPVSSKSVIVDMEGPNMLPLTLIDLPGLIEKCPESLCEDPNVRKNVPKIIADSVREKADKKNALIVMIQQANNDAATSKAYTFVEEIDPKFERTIGVITKVDQGGVSFTDHVLPRLQNKSLALDRHGYFAVINRNDDERDSVASEESVRLREKQYFESSAPHDDSGTAILRRCGVPRLKEYLSNLLLNKVKEDLPKLSIKIAEMLKSTMLELRESELNMPPSETHLKRLELQSKLLPRVKDYVINELSYQNMVASDVREICHKLKDRVAVLCSEKSMAEAVAAVLDQVETRHESDTGKPKRKIHKTSTATKYRDVVNEDFKVTDVEQAEMDNLALLITRARRNELAYFTPWTPVCKVVQYVLNNIAAECGLHAVQCIDEIGQQASAVIGRGIASPLTPLSTYKTFGGSIITPCIGVCKTEVELSLKSTVQDIMTTEIDYPQTVNHYYQRIVEDKKAEKLTKMLNLLKSQFSNAATVNYPGSAIHQAIESFLASQIKEMHNLSNEQAEAETVWICIAAYMQVAYKKIADVVISRIVQETNRLYHDVIWRHAHSVLEEASDDRIDTILSEDPGLVAKRASLRRKKECLGRATEILKKHAY